MRQKAFSFFVITTLFLSQFSFVLAQTIDPTATSDTTTVTEPEPMPDTSTDMAEETMTPPPDTEGPAFISVATASAEETEVNVVWTTDELAFGFVEYGETTSYGLSTPKSSEVALDHTASVTGLTPGTEYHYRIVAEDESGNVSYSKDQTFETSLEVVATDNVPPEISEISVTDITTSGATISWLTDELAQGKVEYGKTAEYGLASPLTPDYATEHDTPLSNLTANTEYHYRIVIKDESGNQATSPDEVFTTSEVATNEPITEPENNTATTTEITENTATSTPSSTTSSTTPTTSDSATLTTSDSTSNTDSSAPPQNDDGGTPQNDNGGASTTPDTTDSTATTTPAQFKISNVEVATVGTSTARIIWNTNEAATSQVYYGAGEILASSSSVMASKVTSHEVRLTNLKPGTNYFYKVISKNSSGKTIFKDNFEFNTLYQEKKLVTAPTISNLSVSVIGTTTATIIWTTNVPAGGEVRYGTTTAYRMSDGGHKNLLTAHTHFLSDLKSNTQYNFVAIARDTYGNETIYENKNFKTLGDTKTAESAPSSDTAESTEQSETVTDETTIAPASGGGAGYNSYTHTITLASPKLIKTEALDKQAMFVWSPKKVLKTISGSTKILTNLVIVRNPERYSESPTFGKIVYSGNSGLFTDTNLENGKTYYYSIFTVSQFNSHSQPVRLKIIPTKTNEGVKFEVVPPVLQKNPIYTFPKPMQKGDTTKQVEHLQVLLASENSLYPKGLITGYFGPLTEKAVKLFQKRYEIKTTGIADKKTLNKLQKIFSVEFAKDKASVYETMLQRNLNLGVTGEDVSTLQQFLVNAEVYPEALITGYFGNLTKSALQKFQLEQNISPATGYFGPITKKRMINLIRLRQI